MHAVGHNDARGGTLSGASEAKITDSVGFDSNRDTEAANRDGIGVGDSTMRSAVEWIAWRLRIR